MLLTEQEAIFSVPEQLEPDREILESLCLVNLEHLNKDNELQAGQIVVHKFLEEDVRLLAQHSIEKLYKIESVIPVASSKFNWNDDLSMRANNSSGFNYRNIAGTERLSLHTFGFAIDINPRENPLISGNKLTPSNATLPVEFHLKHPIVEFLIGLGWTWGGSWEDFQDNHHFEKPLATDLYLENLELCLQQNLLSKEIYLKKYEVAISNSKKLQ